MRNDVTAFKTIQYQSNYIAGVKNSGSNFRGLSTLMTDEDPFFSTKLRYALKRKKVSHSRSKSRRLSGKLKPAIVVGIRYC